MKSFYKHAVINVSAGKNLLTYADKRLAGEIKNAEEGSTLHSVGKAEKSLRPNANVAISEKVSLKFRARVLQGKAIMEVKNPWVEISTVASASGKVKVLTKKQFSEMGFTTGADYSITEAQWIIYADQELMKNVKARVSANHKNHQRAFSNDADKRVEMMASFPFNL